MYQHTDDILALAINNARDTCVTGQVGRAPVLFTWDAVTGEKKQRFKLSKGARGVNCVAFSEDGSLIACADLSNNHNVYVFEADSGNLLWKTKGDTNKIFDIAFSNEPGSKRFATAGVKHLYFWDAAEGAGSKKKGLFGSTDMTSFSCVAWSDKGHAFSGGSNGSIYVWEDRSALCTIDCHKGGFISALTFANGSMFTGGKDGNVFCVDVSSYAAEHRMSYDSPVRAIDVDASDCLVVGLRNGCIIRG